MKQQTAVEWLVEMLYSPACNGFISGRRVIPHDIIEQAKAMEKEQRIRDYNVGYLDAKCNHVQDAENYLVEQEYLASKSAI